MSTDDTPPKKGAQVGPSDAPAVPHQGKGRGRDELVNRVEDTIAHWLGRAGVLKRRARQAPQGSEVNKKLTQAALQILSRILALRSDLRDLKFGDGSMRPLIETRLKGHLEEMEMIHQKVAEPKP